MSEYKCNRCNDTGMIACRSRDAQYAFAGPVPDDAKGYFDADCWYCESEKPVTSEIDDLRAAYDEMVENKAILHSELATKDAEIARLRHELEAYRDAVRVDAQMEGPKFMGCNMSQLRRAWKLTRATLNGSLVPTDGEVVLEPGWLLKDVRRAAARMEPDPVAAMREQTLNECEAIARKIAGEYCHIVAPGEMTDAIADAIAALKCKGEGK